MRIGEITLQQASDCVAIKIQLRYIHLSATKEVGQAASETATKSSTIQLFN